MKVTEFQPGQRIAFELLVMTRSIPASFRKQLADRDGGRRAQICYVNATATHWKSKLLTALWPAMMGRQFLYPNPYALATLATTQLKNHRIQSQQ